MKFFKFIISLLKSWKVLLTLVSVLGFAYCGFVDQGQRTDFTYSASTSDTATEGGRVSGSGGSSSGRSSRRQTEFVFSGGEDAKNFITKDRFKESAIFYQVVGACDKEASADLFAGCFLNCMVDNTLTDLSLKKACVNACEADPDKNPSTESGMCKERNIFLGSGFFYKTQDQILTNEHVANEMLIFGIKRRNERGLRCSVCPEPDDWDWCENGDDDDKDACSGGFDNTDPDCDCDGGVHNPWHAFKDEDCSDPYCDKFLFSIISFFEGYRSEGQSDRYSLVDKVKWWHRDADVAMLTLKTPIETAKPVTLGDLIDVSVGHRIFTIGNPYPEGGRIMKWQDAKGDIVGFGTGGFNYEIYHSIRTYSGNSGGGLYDSETGKIIGIHHSAYTNRPNDKGVGTHINKIEELIKNNGEDKVSEDANDYFNDAGASVLNIPGGDLTQDAVDSVAGYIIDRLQEDD